MNKISKKLSVLVILFSLFVNSVMVQKVFAADTAVFTSLKLNTATNITMTFVVPAAITAGNTLVVTFPSDFDLSAGLVFSDFDLSDDGVDLTLGAAGGGATWGAVADSGARTITFTSGTGVIGTSSVMVLKIGTNATVDATGVHQILNPTVIGSYTINIAGGGTTHYITVYIITNDQVALSAVVGQTLSFAISDNTIGFGNLDISNTTYATGDTSGTTIETAAHTITASTNASSGYTISVTGDTLKFSSNSITAIGGSATALAAGSSQFGLRMSAAGGSGTASVPYASSNYAYGATAVTTSEVAASASPSASTIYSVYYGANISSATVPGAYSTTLTYTISANY